MWVFTQTFPPINITINMNERTRLDDFTAEKIRPFNERGC